MRRRASDRSVVSWSTSLSRRRPARGVRPVLASGWPRPPRWCSLALAILGAVAITVSRFPRGLITWPSPRWRSSSAGTASCAMASRASPGSRRGAAPRRDVCAAVQPLRAVRRGHGRAGGRARGREARRSSSASGFLRRRARRTRSLFCNPKSGGGKAERFQAGRRGARARDRADRAEARATTSRRSCARPSIAAPTRCDGRRRRLAGDRRRDRRRARTCRTRASRPARATTSRSTSASTATTSSARWTRSSTAASGVVDLAEVNGRVFVNNVSLGLYAEAVQHEGYRDAKIRTLLDTVPDALGPDGTPLDLRWTGPTATRSTTRQRPSSSPTTATGSAAPVGSGTRPRIDDGAAGDRGARRPRPAAPARSAWQQWTAPTFEVDPTTRCRPASTARRCCSIRRCGSRSARRAARADRAGPPGRVAVRGRARRRPGRGRRAGPPGGGPAAQRRTRPPCAIRP